MKRESSSHVVDFFCPPPLGPEVALEAVAEAAVADEEEVERYGGALSEDAPSRGSLSGCVSIPRLFK
jgi:hypothetical protein